MGYNVTIKVWIEDRHEARVKELLADTFIINAETADVPEVPYTLEQADCPSNEFKEWLY